MTTISTLPTAPSRSDPSTFSDRSDALLGALATFVSETNTVAGEVNANAATATTQAALATTNGATQVSLAEAQVALATTQATNAAISAAAAASSALVAGATIWVSGTSYTIGGARYSPLNGQVYRRLTNGAGTTDPSADTTNWIVVNGITSEAISLPVNNLPTVRPTLNLDFANSKIVDSRITFSRASTATYVNAFGRLSSSAINAPRIDYDPVTLACKGLLIEESRTNLLTYSEDIANAVYATPIGASVSTANTAPDGAATAKSLIEDTSNSSHAQNVQAYTFVTSTVYTYSVYVKPIGSRNVVLGFPSTVFTARFGSFTLSGDGAIYSSDAGVTATISPAPNGFYRCSISATCASGASSRCTVSITDSAYGLTYTGNGASGIYVWGAQLEAGAFATSYIPTTSAQATRAADVATMTGTNFSSWYRQDEGTFAVAADTAMTSGTAPVLVAQIAGGNDRHQMVIFTSCWNTVVSGAGQSPLGVNTAQSVKAAYAYRNNDFAASISGSIATDTAGTVPSALTYMALGKYDFGGAESLNGHISRLAYYPSRLANATLQAISTP